MFGEIVLEGNRLLEVKILEIAIPGISLKAAQGLSGCIDCRLTVTFGFLEKR
jgi:hypothetical protein